MSRLENVRLAAMKVGVEGRHPTRHLARAISAEQRVYVLHSEECAARGIDLRKCEYSIALDRGIDMLEWGPWQDKAVPVTICDDEGDLLPSVFREGDQEVSRG